MNKAAQSLAILFSAVYLVASCHASSPQSESGVITLMADYTQRGHLDKSIRVGEDWLKKHPEEAPKAGTVFQQIALVYLMKASKSTTHKEEIVSQAVSYLDKALSVATRKDINLGLYEIGRGFEVAGDLSIPSKCVYHNRAVKAFEEQAPLLQAESVTASGRTFPLASVRRENEKALSSSKAKLAAANCR